MPKKIVLGTRGSELARRQTQLAEMALREAWPEVEIEIKILRARGDEAVAPIDRHAGRKGLFTAEIDRALANGEIDVAIHSAKDLPSELTVDLEIRGVLPRAQVADVLISKNAGGLDSLGPGAVVATGSVRRKFQLQWVWPDLEVVDLRGNVPTRLRKLAENKNWEAIVLARAGLERLGIDFAGENLFASELPLEVFLPAGGQGVIALKTRRRDSSINLLVDRINHGETHSCLRAEREFLRLLQGDCDSPVGVFARMIEGDMTISAQIFGQNEREPRVAETTGLAQDPEALAKTLLGKINDA